MNKQKKVYGSIEELMSGCANTTLKHWISSILRDRTRIGWRLVSYLEDNDTGWAEFAAPVEGLDCEYYQSCESTPYSERRHMTICDTQINRSRKFG